MLGIISLSVGFTNIVSSYVVDNNQDYSIKQGWFDQDGGNEG